ncbi:DEKNAAC102971 [Brettanomyces naardenensis]|uniref:DEKNAAC102971 n=1 Tax=Brettanomyces naardenensis TaxID=13370 RepID=A0A448YM96_BRENA|nr:DEKNAAC102971 [Brettanomyces naardenensis]
MSELSAAEKRRILRERRAKKLAANASNRLDRIAGINGPSSVEETTAEKKDEISQDTDGTAATTSAETNETDITRKTIKRASQTADGSSDGIDSRGSYQSSTPDLSSLKIADPLHKNPSEENMGGFGDGGDELDMDNLLRQLLQGMDHSQQHPQDATSEAPPLPDDFMKTISSMLKQSMEGGDASNFPESLNQAAGGGFGGVPPKTANELQAENEMKEYNNYRVARLDILFTLFRYIGIFFLIYTQVLGVEDYQASFQNLRPNIQGSGRSFLSRFCFWSNGDFILRDASSSRFWNLFLLLEVVSSIAYYFARSALPPSPPNLLISLGSGFVPQRYRKIIDFAVQHFDLLKFFLSDLAFVIVVLGAITYYTW